MPPFGHTAFAVIFFKLKLFVQNLTVLHIKFRKGSTVKLRTDSAHHTVVKIEVVQNTKAHPKAFVRFKQVADICL